MFLNQVAYSTGAGSTPYSVAVADVNSDSQPDIVITNTGTNKVGVLLNAGNGIFSNQITYSAGTYPVSVAVADVNSDNQPDIVVVNYNSNSVSVLLNAGSGTFLNQIVYSVGTNPRSVAVADVNNDNKPDIIVGNLNSNNIGVLLNAGNGTFLAQTIYSTGAGSGPRLLTVADVNSDNKPDIIVPNSGASNVGVLLNAGSGTFPAQTSYLTGAASGPYSVAAVDVNSDSHPDIVVANSGLNAVGIFINTGSGTFLAQTTYSTGAVASTRSVVVADVNSDNKPDIVVANYGSTTLGVFLNAGSGTFLAQTTYSTSNNPYSVVVVDVNSDNKPDLVVANYGSSNVGVLLHC